MDEVNVVAGRDKWLAFGERELIDFLVLRYSIRVSGEQLSLITILCHDNAFVK